MSVTAFDLLNTGQERASVLDEAIVQHVRSSLVNLRTLTPAVIASVNGERASAQPLLRSVLFDGTEVQLPLVVDAPIEFPRGGGWTLTFPVKVGDECLIAFSDRSIDEWMQLGGFQTPEYRLHELRDGVIRVGIASDPHMLKDVSALAVELRSNDGLTKVALEPGKITLKALVVNVEGILQVNDVPVTVP